MANGICRQKGNGGLPPLQNSTSCSLCLRHLLVGSQRKVSWNHIIIYCHDFIQYPEQPVLSPVLKMFYNKSRIVSFYAGQNLDFHYLNELLVSSVLMEHSYATAL
ncbi:unnamed protein product [Adineta steineri]|uniref:Uncharacterized protein n=1 Tax=Adineta steineri TaxID=433720 RepID=A0A815NNR1_9BILA|nr:unnamed protein product [Adineta steineri]CAF1628084.1 unnamed protein product [Adineta steineri]